MLNVDARTATRLFDKLRRLLANGAPEADVCTFRGGKLVKLEGFGDTAMQEKVYGKK